VGTGDGDDPRSPFKSGMAVGVDPRSPANRGWDPHPRSPENRGWGRGWGSGVPCPGMKGNCAVSMLSMHWGLSLKGPLSNLPLCSTQWHSASLAGQLIPDSGNLKSGMESWRWGWGWTPDPRQIGGVVGVDPRSPANRGWDPHLRSPANRGWGRTRRWGSGVPCPDWNDRRDSPSRGGATYAGGERSLGATGISGEGPVQTPATAACARWAQSAGPSESELEPA
jgi:hypothetical protein